MVWEGEPSHEEDDLTKGEEGQGKEGKPWGATKENICFVLNPGQDRFDAAWGAVEELDGIHRKEEGGDKTPRKKNAFLNRWKRSAPRKRE